MKKKLLYEQPTTELFVVRIESTILSGGGIQDIKDDNVEDDSENWG